jgi:SAM-dependent methyltransferase
MFQEKEHSQDSSLIEWGDLWNQKVMRRREYGRVTYGLNQWSCKKSALKYWEECQNIQAPRIKDTLNEICISPASRVLDIGAGPGVLTIPLAKQVKEVTAIEPMHGMTMVFREKLACHGIKNIRLIEKFWEDVDIEQDLAQEYDVVLASLSLNMVGIQESLQKMNRVCSGFVYLYWFAGEPFWEKHSKTLIPLIHGVPFMPMPKCDILFNVLYQMEIVPHVKVFPYCRTETHNSFQDLLDEFYDYYNATTVSQKDIIKRYLKKILTDNGTETGDGVSLPSRFTCVQMWWRKKMS